MEKRSFQPGGLDLSYTSLCILARVYTNDSLLIKDIRKLWPNIQYAFGVQCIGRFCTLNFTLVFSEPGWDPIEGPQLESLVSEI